jgi:hypothetical protein
MVARRQRITTETDGKRSVILVRRDNVGEGELAFEEHLLMPF